MRRVSWRLMPFLIVAYLLCYCDRVNVGFAALQMNKAVGIDPKTYGLGAGIFFIGYFLLEVPSNLGLEKFGAHTWIARIMLTWGLVSGAFALIGGPISFLVLRFMLGAAEAGFFPGVILYLTYWFSAVYRAKIVGIFMVAIPIAGLIGSPISGAILGMDGIWDLGGWQWILILEAIPTLFLGVAAFVWLTDRPEHAPWLAPRQQQWLIARLAAENRRAPKVAHQSVWSVMRNKYVLIKALVYAGAAGASTSLAPWMPALVKSFGLTNFQTGLVNAIPFGIAAVWMIPWGRGSDRSGERVWHNALPLMWMIVAMVLTFFFIKTLWVIIPLMTLIAAGTYASKSPFWALSSEWLGASTAAAGPRADQRAGQPVRLLLQLHDRLDQGRDRQLPAGHHADRRRGSHRHDLRSVHRSQSAAHRRRAVVNPTRKTTMPDTNIPSSVRARVSEAEWQARLDCAAVYRLLAHFNQIDLIGNHITLRVPGDNNRIPINPYGWMYEEITASSLVTIDLEGNELLNPHAKEIGVNYAGYVIHSAVHSVRHDISCVIHTHTRAGMAVSSLECGFLPMTQTAIACMPVAPVALLRPVIRGLVPGMTVGG